MRLDNWPALMFAEINRHDKPFAWGINDCCIFAADVVLAVSGVDHMTDFRGRYSDRTGAQQALRQFGCASLRIYMTRILGPLQSVSSSHRGDVVYQSRGGLMGARLGICVGELSAFVGESENHSGIVYERTLQSDGCWHV